MTVAHDQLDFKTLGRLARSGQGTLVPMYRRVMSDTLTPVLAYRRLVSGDDRMAPSFLLESVVGGERVGRYSYLGSQPFMELIARGREVEIVGGPPGAISSGRSRGKSDKGKNQYECDDPLGELARFSKTWKLAKVGGLPEFAGGWVGYAAYDTIRYLEGQKLGPGPADDRGLPDVQMGLYRKIVAFDHVMKTIVVVTHVALDEHRSLKAAYDAGQRELDELVARLATPRKGPTTLGLAVRGIRGIRGGRGIRGIRGGPTGVAELPLGEVTLDGRVPGMPVSTMGKDGYQRAVRIAKEHIAAGDIFQVVPSQRFDLVTEADPFDIYRALRVVNPSPYMFYLQIQGGMLVGSSPEILCRVHDGAVVSRPLAGTRRRGATAKEDAALEKELLADPKERAEHIMLVDLGRNDLGRVCRPGSIKLPQLMAIERYSHVMHISSTVTGQLAKGKNCWDALRYTLPVGTVSGAPKIRAMQIIDDLEPTRRGPYAGAVGYADFAGNLDMAIALRTMVVTPHDEKGPTAAKTTSYRAKLGGLTGPRPGRRWSVHIQAGSGIVADSDPAAEHQETINKAAALAKAVELAERAFGTAAERGGGVGARRGAARKKKAGGAKGR